MNWELLPWDKGLAFCVALVTLKMLYDAVYKKIPRGLRGVRQEIRQQTQVVLAKHSEAVEVIRTQGETIARLEDAIETLINTQADLQSQRARSPRRRKRKPPRETPGPF